ncbi:MAG: DUF2784 domain-containing protein [Rhodocyclaceae bacterium]|nr:DUF2784 domain-containing protein [Rhodocyclaceae bacterium]
MVYRYLADAVLFLHLAFILFVVLGAFLAWHFPRLAWLHLPMATWGAIVEIAGYTCPLTPLENYLRQMGGDAGYHGGFIEHYLMPVIYPEALTREVQIALGVGVIVLNIAAYAARPRPGRRIEHQP